MSTGCCFDFTILYSGVWPISTEITRYKVRTKATAKATVESF